jgi:hypothetical protein
LAPPHRAELTRHGTVLYTNSNGFESFQMLLFSTQFTFLFPAIDIEEKGENKKIEAISLPLYTHTSLYVKNVDIP